MPCLYLGALANLKLNGPPLGSMLSARTTAAQYAAGTGSTEKLSPEGKAFSSYFLNFGYSIDAYEVLLNYRTVSSTVDTPLNKTSGVGALLGGKDVLSSSSTTTSISIGVGYRF